MATVGFVGLGAMGSRMAANLVRAGHSVRVWNRDRAKMAPLTAAGAIAAANPADAARGASVVVVIVADDEADRAVIAGADGVLAGCASGTVIVDSTTATPGASRALGRLAVERGCALLDAPVLGSLAQAENRELVFVVGGTDEAFAGARPVMEAMGRLVRHVGPPGAGATLKLVNNMVAGVLTAVLGECALVAEAAGVDHAVLAEIVGEGAAGSRLTRSKLPKIARRDFAPQFQLALMEKDLRYFLALAAEVDRPTPIASLAANLYRAARRAGHGGEDSCAVFRTQSGER
jgi:3-hydroxyisobutyrate dehydrogenase